MSSIGHNGGPSMEAGASFRRIAWARSRKALMPNNVPLEILRRRVARAQALGLPYRTYAAVRAATGEDIEAMLFTSNALTLLRPHDALPSAIATKLAKLDTRRHATLAARIPATALAPIPFTSTRPAPRFTASWSALRDEMQTWLRSQALAGDRVLMIGDTRLRARTRHRRQPRPLPARRQLLPGARPVIRPRPIILLKISPPEASQPGDKSRP